MITSSGKINLSFLPEETDEGDFNTNLAYKQVISESSDSLSFNL